MKTNIRFVCDHDPHFVTADILEGDVQRIGVQWCQQCGSFRRFRRNAIDHDLLDHLGEWREPNSITEGRI